MQADLRILAPLLAALAAIGPFSIDTYLPAFPAIGRDLGASQIEVQQTLTAYLVPFGFMILWHGAFSDALGRRRVILVTLFLFALSSLVCAFATGIEMLWLGRALQGMCAGSGMVVGRAIIRDVLHDGPAAQRLMSTVAVMFGLAPAIAPVIGGWIFAALGWRAVFGFLVLFGGALFALCYFFMPETLPPQKRQSLHPAWLARSYLGVFSHGEFLLLSGALAFNFSAFFIYVLSAPVFLMQHLRLSPQEFGWMFIPGVVGMMGGSFYLRPARRQAVAAAHHRRRLRRDGRRRGAQRRHQSGAAAGAAAVGAAHRHLQLRHGSGDAQPDPPGAGSAAQPARPDLLLPGLRADHHQFASPPPSSRRCCGARP
ncbi:MAG: multidrug effflux MFS transporter [Comamonadaceae bacterium]|nr:multidrug effflux MFS transporter [Comamonadaceae bacterium]